TALAVSTSPNVIHWTPLGPAPINDSAEDYGNVSGRVTAIAVDQSDTTGNTVFVGGAYGGVWKTTNGADPDANAVKWTALTDDQPTLAIGSIALKPDNLDCKSAAPTNCVILVGTGEPDNAGDSYYGLGVMRFDPTAAACPDGSSPLNKWCLIRSADSGLRPFRGLGFSKIAFNSDPGKTEIAVAAAATTTVGRDEGAEQTGIARGLYYSRDAGVTWSYSTLVDPSGKASATPDPQSATSVVYNAPLHSFFAAIRFHGFYSSSDGETWT